MFKNKQRNDRTINEINERDKGQTWPQVLAILTGALASFTDGLLFAWSSPFIVKLVQDKENYDITESEAFNLIIIPPVVTSTCCIFLAKSCDKIGRKKVILLLSVPQFISLIISACARSIYIFYLSRIVAGISDALLWSSMPLYIGEVASPEVRGVWGNAMASSMYLGGLAINVVGSYLSVTTTSYIFSVVPVLFFIAFLFMPESPYYYIMKKDYDSAKKSLKFLTRKVNVDNDFLKLKADVERQQSESSTWKDIINIQSNRKALFAALFLRFSQHFTGAPVLHQYIQYIFQRTGGSVSPQIISIIFSGFSVVLNLLAVIFIVDKYSRKKLFQSSLGLCSIVLLILATYFYLDEKTHIDLSSVNWIPLAAVVSYQIVYSYGGGVIPTLMMGELFSVSIKTKAMTVLIVALGIGLFLTSGVFNVLNSLAGVYAPFLFFTVCTISSTILTHYIIPETKGKTLEEIQMTLKMSKNN